VLISMHWLMLDHSALKCKHTRNWNKTWHPQHETKSSHLYCTSHTAQT